MPDNYIENALNQNNETIIADFDKTTETFDINDIYLSPILSKCPCSEKSTKMYQNFYTISTARTIAVDQEAFISRLSNKFVTSLDMTSAYFQIELSEESKPLTSFYVDTVTYPYMLAEDVTGIRKCAKELCFQQQGPQQDQN